MLFVGGERERERESGEFIDGAGSSDTNEWEAASRAHVRERDEQGCHALIDDSAFPFVQFFLLFLLRLWGLFSSCACSHLQNFLVGPNTKLQVAILREHLRLDLAKSSMECSQGHVGYSG